MILGFATLLVVSFAIQKYSWAQESDNKNNTDTPTTAATDDEKKNESPGIKVQRGAGGKKVYVIKTGFVIEGRIQKPNAFYVLQRSQINYNWSQLKQNFVPRILDTLRKSPF